MLAFLRHDTAAAGELGSELGRLVHEVDVVVQQLLAAGLVCVEDVRGTLLLWEESSVGARKSKSGRAVPPPILGGHGLANLMGGLLCSGRRGGGVGFGSGGSGRDDAEAEACEHKVLFSELAKTRGCDGCGRCVGVPCGGGVMDVAVCGGALWWWSDGCGRSVGVPCGGGVMDAAGVWECLVVVVMQ